MEKVVGALEKLGRGFTRLVVDPAGGKSNGIFLARGGDFDCAEAVENEFFLAQCAFGKNEEKVSGRKPNCKIGAANGFFHAAREFFQDVIHG